ncbi:MAG: bifunctional folylpolyglutamate synthase/dihydrofolate synthase [Syntrophomonadaceae bacterium]|nr:bifunctional folylpolyglutamate synthase/dihydrofolate synthase [Syntrophomonadaceae bacterium]
MGSKPGLDTTRSLLSEMGDPQEDLKYIHVGGTNGKGSVSLIIANILTKAGYKVGRYTSPHLTSYCERFTVDNEPVTPEELKNYLDLTEKCIQKMLAKGLPHPTEFEVLTAVAFQFFRDKGVDFAVLEVGMGGIFDSTNVIIPLVSVITSVSFDHTQYLGETIEEIAFNKAGIIKTGVPVVTGLMDERAIAVIRAEAEIKNSPLLVSQSVKVEQVRSQGLHGQTVRFNGAMNTEEELEFSLAGMYQLENLATALTALSVLKDEFNISRAALRDGLCSLTLNGRMQVLNENPLVIADVAHNAEGARALACSLKTLLPRQSNVMVIGIVDDKDAHSILALLGGLTKACIITRPEGERSSKWEKAADVFRNLFPDIFILVEADIHQAMDKGLDLLDESDYLLVTGSFYVLKKACQFQFNN